MDTLSLRRAIIHFLAEDIGSGDITSETIFPPDQEAIGRFVAKEDFVACGIDLVAREVFEVQNPAIEVRQATEDGSAVAVGDILLEMRGPVLDLLRAERVALNLAQRLCGIATMTGQFVRRVSPLPVRIVDTRKTTPGLRFLEKYAVKVGGGFNHRFNLADGVLVKDNHIKACGSIRDAVARITRHVPHTMKIEVETTTIDEVRECLSCGVDVIMLDNMTPAMMREAVKVVDGRALIEASGGVTLDNVRQIAETGVDLISVGRLTHSAPACDISMRLEGIAG